MYFRGIPDLQGVKPGILPEGNSRWELGTNKSKNYFDDYYSEYLEVDTTENLAI